MSADADRRDTRGRGILWRSCGSVDLPQRRRLRTRRCQLNLSKAFKETKREGDAEKGYQFTVAVAQGCASTLIGLGKTSARAAPAADTRSKKSPSAATVFKHGIPLTHIAASSTRVDRVPLRLVPAYTLAVDPKQAHRKCWENQGKPFDVLLRVHSYATQPSKLSVGLDPARWIFGQRAGGSFLRWPR